jgi:hypothetical protein
MADDVQLTIRVGPKVKRERHESLAGALEALESRMRVIEHGERRGTIDLRYKTFEPIQQVAARAEVSAGRMRGGIDLRGDGSTEAWTGRWRRGLVEQQKGESAYAALARALGAGG